MLDALIREHGTRCWLVNTGWVGGKYGVGSRISLSHTRAIIDAIHSGVLSHPSSSSTNPESSASLGSDAEIYWKEYGSFGLFIPTSVPGVPTEILDPSQAWADEEAFDRERFKLAALFRRAFRMFEPDVAQAVRDAGPKL